VSEPASDHEGLSLESAGDFAGQPDAFGRLWTPHRMAYIKGEGKPADDDAGDSCPFCRAPQRSDEEGLILTRGQVCYAVLNLYPYNAGHLMAVPYRHVADLTELSTDEASEIVSITQAAMRTLRAVSAPHGFNLGINQGAVAGAGIAARRPECCRRYSPRPGSYWLRRGQVDS
jgi:ATP adenylyltransferase